ncbi:MAG: hypothetical protein CYG60_00940 [Actinobacteria bacterium]|nr:MAG: hypothetical protein CYG60_00940 [Actinomycetota bacterium]
MRTAEAVSKVTRQPVLAIPLFLALGFAATPNGIAWALACLVVTTVLPLLYLLYLYRSGRVEDPGRIARGERTGPLWVVSAFWVVAFAAYALLGLPEVLRGAFLAYLFVTPVLALLTPYTNPSLHAAGAAWAAVCLTLAFGPAGLVSVVLLPVTWWARTILKRHTPTELLLGTLVSGVLTLVAFYLAA